MADQDTPDAGSGKKEKVLHARISEHLDEELRRRSSRLGVSISNLVRNALNHTFGLVEDVIADGASVARSARAFKTDIGGGADLPLDDGAAGPAVIAWQRVVLNVDANCAQCGKPLSRGAPAALGAPVSRGAVILCIADMEREVGLR